jgi:D-sedoheptulose 7-phosphate isomerase
MKIKIEQIIQTSINNKISLLEDKLLLQKIIESVELIADTFAKGNRIYFCGNGGSAADAQHLAAEFSGRFYQERKALPAEALHCNTSYITAVGNDYGYDFVYSRIIDGIGNSGDVLVGISTSGNSKNIVLAMEIAKTKGIHTIALTGESGGKLKETADILINVPSNDTPRIQECHILIGHIICQLVEEKYFN